MIPVETKPFKKINSTLFKATVCTLVFLFGYGYFLYTVNTTRQNVLSLTKETAVLEAEESEAGQIKKELTATEAKRSVLVSYFVDVNNPIPFEETIESYGKKTNTMVSFQGLEVKKTPSRLDASFTVNGSFVDLYKFFALLESAPYELSVKNLDLQTNGASSKDSHINSWQARVSLSVFSVTGVQ